MPGNPIDEHILPQTNGASTNGNGHQEKETAAPAAAGKGA
jgi:hypothetical protein